MISIKSLFLIVLIICIIIFVIYAILVIKDLLVTAKSINKISEDAGVVSEFRERRSPDFEDVKGDVKMSAGGIASALKGEESKIEQVASVISGIASLIGVFTGRPKSEE